MKNFMKRFSALLLVFVMVMGLSVTAFAVDSTVTFKGFGEKGGFDFQPGSAYSAADLFDNFKNVMPGDELTETIRIKNEARDCDYIKLYLRAEVHDEDGNPLTYDEAFEHADGKDQAGVGGERDETVATMQDFLSQLHMRVYNGDQLIYDSTPDQEGALAENVFLAKLTVGETAELTVELDVPIELGNEYSNRVGEVDWIFTAEGFDRPSPPPDDDTMVTVRKVWVDNGVDRPERVTVHLLRNGKLYKEVELSQKNQWAYTWDRLDDDYDWSVVEADVPDGYEAAYVTKGNTTTITNTRKESPPSPPDTPDPPTSPDTPDPPTPPDTPDPVDPVDLSVVKKWDDHGKDRPESVKVTLYNGETAVESVWLGAWNNWSYTWRDLAGNGNWQIIETSIPKGYTPSYLYRNGVVTVTNTEALIQTGQLNWPIPVLGGLGLLLIASGFILITKKRRNDRA